MSAASRSAVRRSSSVVQIGLLPDRLRLVLGLLAERLRLPARGRDQRLGLGLRALGVGPAVFLHPGADLFDLGEPARLEVVTLARGVLPGHVRLATGLLAHPFGVDVRPIQRLARLLLGQPQDVGGPAAEVRVVDLRGGLPGLLELVGHGGQLLFEFGATASNPDQRALEAADVVVHGVAVVAPQGRRKVPTALAASSKRPRPVLSAEVMLAPCPFVFELYE